MQRILFALLGTLTLNLSAFAAALPAPDSFAGNSFQYVGDAVLLEANLIRLTSAQENQLGALWLETPTTIATGFVVDFQFRISEPGGHPFDWEPGVTKTGADGFAFVIQNHSPTSIGLFASGIGYYGIPNSLAVEFDTWNNKPSYCEPNGNHLAINTLGTAANRPEHCAGNGADGSFPNPTLAIAPLEGDLADGNIHSSRIIYQGGRMEVYLDGRQVLASAVNLEKILQLDAKGRAYLGFTSSTGGAWENHDLISLSVSEIPEPGTLFLISGGLLLFATYRRR